MNVNVQSIEAAIFYVTGKGKQKYKAKMILEVVKVKKIKNGQYLVDLGLLYEQLSYLGPVEQLIEKNYSCIEMMLGVAEVKYDEWLKN